jgi:tripartite-type tricarboxylate transporter receptor subunit TctC
VLQQPDVRERLVAMGADVVGSSPEEFGTFMQAESTKWAKDVKEANIRAE